MQRLAILARVARACLKVSPRVTITSLLQLFFVAAANTTIADTVPIPQISEAPAGSHGFPFFSSALNLADYGYVESEYFIAGSAQSYAPVGAVGNDGKWDVAPVAGSATPYKVRMMVRRPANPKHFNGTVVVEWLNVSGGIDATPDWALMYEELLREGYAYVAVSAQFIGVGSLRQWEQGADARYASLFQPGDSFSYDIYSQAAMAIRQPSAGAPKPLGALTRKVRSVIATGHSQSGSRLFTYANTLQPVHQVYDALLVHGAFGGSAISQSTAASFLQGGGIPAPPGVPATADIPTPPIPFLRDDLGQPVIILNSETEVNQPFASLGVHLQPDSAMIRVWEVTGSAHADAEQLASVRADANKSLGASGERDCGDLPVNDGRGNGQVVRAAISALYQWVRWGREAANAERIAVDDTQFPPRIIRDPVTGMAVGGIRMPDVAVPTATLNGVRPLGIVANDQNCFLFGARDSWNGDTDSYDGQPYDISGTPEPNLMTLYPSRPVYVSQVLHSAIEAMFAGFLRPADALREMRAAAQAPVPQ